jgi:hypothetical protein
MGFDRLPDRSDDFSELRTVARELLPEGLFQLVAS